MNQAAELSMDELERIVELFYPWCDVGHEAMAEIMRRDKAWYTPFRQFAEEFVMVRLPTGTLDLGLDGEHE